MTAQELLSDLTERDAAFTVDDEQLRVDAPRGLITDELRRELEEHKPELIELIRQQRSQAAPDADTVAAMTLDDFAAAGLIVRVWSKLLGSEVLFVSDDVPDDALAGTDLPVYRTNELRKLAILRPPPRNLHRIHDVKTIFSGAIADVWPRDDHAARVSGPRREDPILGHDATVARGAPQPLVS